MSELTTLWSFPTQYTLRKEPQKTRLTHLHPQALPGARSLDTLRNRRSEVTVRCHCSREVSPLPAPEPLMAFEWFAFYGIYYLLM